MHRVGGVLGSACIRQDLIYMSVISPCLASFMFLDLAHLLLYCLWTTTTPLFSSTVIYSHETPLPSWLQPLFPQAKNKGFLPQGYCPWPLPVPDPVLWPGYGPGLWFGHEFEPRFWLKPLPGPGYRPEHQIEPEPWNAPDAILWFSAPGVN